MRVPELQTAMSHARSASASPQWILITSAACLIGGLSLPAAAAIVGPGFQESGYQLVYDLNLPSASNYDGNGGTVPYSTNNSGSITASSFTRIGYYMELQTASGSLQWISLSVDAFTTSASQIGVPTTASGAIFQQSLSNMNVFSNVGTIVTGIGLAGGNIEFWSNCYAPTNTAGVPNASGSTFDWGDDRAVGSPTCYGSMQIANHNANQMLFSYNQWDQNGTDDLGIGNATSGPHPDWTFTANAGTYTIKELAVFVNAAPEPASITLLAGGLLGLGAMSRRRRRVSA